MSLIIALGTNLGQRKENLARARQELSKIFEIVEESQIYESAAVDYTDQPAFLNQVIEYKIPKLTPSETLSQLLAIELKMGRVRKIKKGPRLIDLDILFWGMDEVQLPELIIPHPEWKNRSFIVLPLMELPFFQTLQKCITIPTRFNNEAHPYK
ncbi:MAG: 2-amino-4-hydroxy-6-hydroxymethyldihydropteridine diphosphokinase [Bacteriovoracaceae bacterium]|nr:2-amino-4-hydroxy-6-hydroxymethyldihydropteridine diphosphokinase [Bacteriovoracaceae bacterium]